MQAIMEPIFEIPYLIGVVVIGILTIRKASGNGQFVLFGAMAIVLGCGDAFHLVPRMWALFSTGTTSLPEFAPALGFGKLVTSITMTIFYVMLYLVWQLRYQKRSNLLTATVCILAASRVVLCLQPQNDWLSADAPLSWGIYRNIPFVIMGLVIIILYFQQVRKTGDRAFRFMWLAIALSFLFYIPVVLFADAIPMIGMLMIPKTCAYVWIVLMGFRDAKGSEPVLNVN
jgi:hypothetical protein